MPNYTIVTQEVSGLVELQALLQTISTNEKAALRDIQIVQSPREGRFIVIWEEK